MITPDSDGVWLRLPAHDTDEKLGPAACFHDTNELGRGGLCRLCGGAYLWDCRKAEMSKWAGPACAAADKMEAGK